MIDITRELLGFKSLEEDLPYLHSGQIICLKAIDQINTLNIQNETQALMYLSCVIQELNNTALQIPYLHVEHPEAVLDDGKFALSLLLGIDHEILTSECEPLKQVYNKFRENIFLSSVHNLIEQESYTLGHAGRNSIKQKYEDFIIDFLTVNPEISNGALILISCLSKPKPKGFAYHAIEQLTSLNEAFSPNLEETSFSKTVAEENAELSSAGTVKKHITSLSALCRQHKDYPVLLNDPLKSIESKNQYVSTKLESLSENETLASNYFAFIENKLQNSKDLDLTICNLLEITDAINLLLPEEQKYDRSKLNKLLSDFLTKDHSKSLMDYLNLSNRKLSAEANQQIGSFARNLLRIKQIARDHKRSIKIFNKDLQEESNFYLSFSDAALTSDENINFGDGIVFNPLDFKKALKKDLPALIDYYSKNHEISPGRVMPVLASTLYAQESDSPRIIPILGTKELAEGILDASEPKEGFNSLSKIFLEGSTGLSPKQTTQARFLYFVQDENNGEESTQYQPKNTDSKTPDKKLVKS